MAGALGKEFDALSLNRKYPVRPCYGTKGQTVTLWANYVEMTPPRDLELYRYNIVVKDKKVAGRKREQIVRLALSMGELAEFSGEVVTDFKATLISRRLLTTTEYRFIYRAEKEDPPVTGEEYKVSIELDCQLSVLHLLDYLNSTSLSDFCLQEPQIITALNILIRHYAKSQGNLAALGSSKTFSLDSTARWDLGQCLVALRGYFSSVRVATGRILVNVNVSHGAFYAPVALTRLMDLHWDHRNGSIDISKMPLFQGLRVTVTHIRRQNSAGEWIPGAKTIFGFATTDDGDGQEEKRPKVRCNGATPKDVQFFLEDSSESSNQSGDKSKGPRKGKPPGGPSVALAAGRHVTVSQYFKTSKSTTI